VRTDRGEATRPAWKDRKKYLWLLGLIIPALVVTSWLAVKATGMGAFWWTGPITMFGIIPILDYLVGPDTENPPESALAWLEKDPYYRWATYLYLPTQYLSRVVAWGVWWGGGWGP
jgi:alkane 1-monooxygenase